MTGSDANDDLERARLLLEVERLKQEVGQTDAQDDKKSIWTRVKSAAVGLGMLVAGAASGLSYGHSTVLSNIDAQCDFHRELLKEDEAYEGDFDVARSRAYIERHCYGEPSIFETIPMFIYGIEDGRGDAVLREGE
ncbi:MAG: hypothetical protein AAF618_02740 [Pseudomonadota bacterium]